MSQQTHRGAEVPHGGTPTASRTDATDADQRLLLGLIMLTCEQPVFAQLPLETSASNCGMVTGVDLMLDRVSKVCCALTMNGLISSIFVTF